MAEVPPEKKRNDLVSLTIDNLETTAAKDIRVLFVSSSGKVFKFIPFIKSQYESLQPFVTYLDNYRVQGSGIGAYRIAYKELKEKLKKEHYDVIHAHWTYSGIICALLVKKEKLVISFMGNDLQGFYSDKYNIVTLKGFISILLSQLLILKTDGIIVKSKRMLKWIPFYAKRKAEVIPNGVNLAKFRHIEQSEARDHLKLDHVKKYILFLSDTTDANKNFELFQKALPYVDKAGIFYEVLTPYPVESSLVPYYMAAADVFAFPSKLEGSPNVIKEALAMNCPIVSTDVGDARERIEGIEGCYIADFDEVSLADQLIRALRFGKRIDASAKLAEISESNIASRILELYERCLHRSTPKLIE